MIPTYARISTLLVIATFGVVAGCAERDEIIAIVPSDGGSGAGGPAIVLEAPVDHALACGQASDAAVADVDEDGIADLLVGGDCLNVLRGDGDALGVAESVVMSGFGTAFAIGHIDSTHPATATDPVDVIGFSQPVQVHLGIGDGTFDVHLAVDAGAPGAASTIALADLYADDSLELITSADDELSLWTGDGAGAFVGPHPFTAPSTIRAVNTCDTNGDDLADLLVVTDDGVAVLRNLGDGDIASPLIIAGTERVREIALVDLDGDTCLDAVAIEGSIHAPAPSDGNYLTLRNDCSGTLIAEVVAPAPNAVSITTGDLDGDGTPDVIIGAAGTAPAVLFARGLADGLFEALREREIDDAAGRVLVVDLDGDTRQDVIVIVPTTNGVATLRSIAAD